VRLLAVRDAATHNIKDDQGLRLRAIVATRPTRTADMRTDTPQMIRLKDYRPSNYLIDTVHLDVSLDPTRTRVTSKLKLRPNPAHAGKPGALRLDGSHIELVSIALDGRALDPKQYSVEAEALVITRAPDKPFTLDIVTLCNPEANTALSGLYLSRGIWCTQCEAEGFRRITYYLDRPDVLARFTTRIEADREAAPVLLGNGNPRERGTLAGGKRHYAIWVDPHPKPSYLFALVGGNLASVTSRFTTMSGRAVDLGIYVEPGKDDRCAWAMDCLKRSMTWDEQAFGREYDLDVFNIVAVSDFNMGAMENKGLNIFNDRLVLATAQTATDGSYLSIERVIAHEYFHNWTGDRITCRDWFQLCLKEGLTVYRDQEFSADTHSRPVQRITNVRNLKAAQFPEDAGPLAHPVRPDHYMEINNFYTTTVYEKGAELVRMIATLLGPKLFRRGMDLYFKRHDGEAATVEDFVACFAEVSKRDLAQFMIWYAQAGTPNIDCAVKTDPKTRTTEVSFTQILQPTPGQPKKKPLHIPVRIGLLGADGRDLSLKLVGGGTCADGLVELTKRQETFRFEGIAARPVPSILRGFTAPVNLTLDLSDDDLEFLIAHDSDTFNRWQAATDYATRILVAAAAAFRTGSKPAKPKGYIEALRRVIIDETLETAYRAQILSFPGEGEIARAIGHDVDPASVQKASLWLMKTLGVALGGELERHYLDLEVRAPYSPEKTQIGARSLRGAALSLLSARGQVVDWNRVTKHFEKAKNLTDEITGLSILRRAPSAERDKAFERFHKRWHNDHLVIDNWFTLQAMTPGPRALALTKRLTKDPLFSMKNPNKVRALLFAFAGNQASFHRADGAGYAYLASKVLELDRINPQVAARMAGAFRNWRTLEAGRQALARAAITEIAATQSLSRDVTEIATKMLA
jgi:aminopeptidase N